MNSPLVVGYKGEIGSFILNGLLRVMPKALNIWCVDINESESEILERIDRSDVIFLCVPLDITTSWISKYSNVLQGKTIIEQSSIKSWTNEPQFQNLDIRSMHILFRPSATPNLDDRQVGLLRSDFDDNFAKEIAAITQSKIIWYFCIEDHEKEMAIQQALTHRILLTLGCQLEKCQGSTYISKKVIELSNRIQNGDLGLYRAIQNNVHLDSNLIEFENELNNFEIEKYMSPTIDNKA